MLIINKLKTKIVFNTINLIYEKKFRQLEPANKQLIGKIKNEHSLFFNGTDSEKMTKHNLLTDDVLFWFEKAFKHYLTWNKVKKYKLHLNSIWVNEMKEHEYNPVHVHQGELYTGLSSVMMLKLPESYGVEYSASDQPANGKLNILGSSSGQFSNIDYAPNIEERDFFIFPYDMRHCVNPFNGPGFRRSLAANMDVLYDPIKHRGVS